MNTRLTAVGLGVVLVWLGTACGASSAPEERAAKEQRVGGCVGATGPADTARDDDDPGGDEVNYPRGCPEDKAAECAAEGRGCVMNHPAGTGVISFSCTGGSTNQPAADGDGDGDGACTVGVVCPTVLPECPESKAAQCEASGQTCDWNGGTDGNGRWICVGRPYECGDDEGMEPCP
jgi:hypothetical protein